jgi:uncharacterized membrane protein YccC
MSAGWLGDWIARNRGALRLSLRITLASLATFAIGHLLHLAQAYWAVLTALIVTQASVGGSLKASLDRFVGSLGGAAWGVAVSLSLPHTGVWSLALTLVVAIAPLAVVTALKPAYRIASITAVILLLTPTSQSAGPLVAATQRMLEVGLGSLVAMAAALLILPERAHGILARTAAEVLETMGDLIVVLMAGLADPRDAKAVEELHGRVRKGVIAAEAAADEAARERRVNLSGVADPEPLCRTLRRLHNDLIMIGRASAEPLAEPVRSVLTGPASDTAAAIGRFLRDSGRALADARDTAPMAGVEQALAGYAAALAEVRKSGLTRDLPDEAVGRIFGLTFALEQMRLNLHDLTDRAREQARPATA